MRKFTKSFKSFDAVAAYFKEAKKQSDKDKYLRRVNRSK